MNSRTSASALFVSTMDPAIDGWFVTAVLVPVQAGDAQVTANRYYLASGKEVRFDLAQPDSRIGDLSRVREEALGQSTYYVSERQLLEIPKVGSWLFPVVGLHTDYRKCRVTTKGFNFFKSADLQMAAWSRFMWGTTFFDDPVTPKEHTSKALNETLKVGDAICIEVDRSVNAVLVLEVQIDVDEFAGRVCMVGNCHLAVGDELESVSEMMIEGVAASFRSRIGCVTEIAAGD